MATPGRARCVSYSGAQPGSIVVVEESAAYPITHRNAFIPFRPEAITFISKFDATGVGKPFNFELEVP